MWADAFLVQATSDWEIYAKLKEAKEPACHVLHYLQMSTEKLGKAYLLLTNAEIEGVQISHQAFTRFLKLIARNSKLQKVLGMTAVQLRAHVRQILPVANAIEKLAPALAGKGVNAEYPWQSPDGLIVAPIRYKFSLSYALQETNGRNLLKLVETVLDNFFVLHYKRRKGA
jgi:hypothetical protein